jgi:hypothetical protein
MISELPGFLKRRFLNLKLFVLSTAKRYIGHQLAAYPSLAYWWLEAQPWQQL